MVWFAAIVLVFAGAHLAHGESRITCADAGVLLRGEVNELKNAATKEAAIASACLHGKWSREVLACIGSERFASDKCLEQLDRAQLELLDHKLAAWGEAHDEAYRRRSEPAKRFDCANNGIGDVATYAPPLAVTGENLALAVALRRDAVQALCNAGWPEQVRACFARGDAVENCRQQLTKQQQKVVVRQLAAADALVAAAAALRNGSVTNYDCAAVAKMHYSDDAWSWRVPPPSDARAAVELRKRIAAARSRMAEACHRESWPPIARACVVAAGTGDACLAAFGQPFGRWEFR